MKVTLVAYTQWNPALALKSPTTLANPEIYDPEHITATGKRICQSGQPLSEIMEEYEKVHKRNIATLNPKNPRRGHMGVFEHISFTFLLEGISRVMTHQLVRHRKASYLQMSQRAVPMDTLELIVPPTIPGDTKMKFFDAMIKCYTLYDKLLKQGIPMGDARYIIPHGMETRIWITINARSLMHFFKERLINPAAQWEIKHCAQLMHDEVMKICPTIFDLKYQECWE